MQALRDGLADAGWSDGRNCRLEVRWSGGELAKLASDARELVALAPDVIVTSSNPGLAGVLAATRSIPTIFTGVGDPVAAGFVPNLSHPGGNATGFALYAPSIAEKWLALLKDAAPQVKAVTLLFNAATPSHAQYRAGAETAAAALSIKLISVDVNNADDIRHALGMIEGGANAGLMVLPHTLTSVNRALVIASAAEHKIPAVYPFPFFAHSGGLMSYGPDLVDQFRLAGAYVDRVLRGEKPGDLPVQNSTKFSLIINLKTAATLGLDLPPARLAQADEVIE